MTKNQIINRIFNLSEITYTSTKFIYIDKYSNNSIEISDVETKLFISDLLTYNILELDSGNFETKEMHYILHSDFYKNEHQNRIILFNKILERIEERTKIYNIKKVFEDFKNKEIRKQKLKNLNKFKITKTND